MRSTTIALLAVGILLAGTAAIAAPNVSIELRALRPTYEPGKAMEMTVVLTNLTGQPVEVAQYGQPWGIAAVELSVSDAKGRPLPSVRVPFQGKATPKPLQVPAHSYLAYPVYLNFHARLTDPGEVDVIARLRVPGVAEDALPTSLPVRMQIAATSPELLAAEADKMAKALLALAPGANPQFTVFRLGWTMSARAAEPLANWLVQKASPWDSWYVEEALRYLHDDGAVRGALLQASASLGISRAMANALKAFGVPVEESMKAIVSSLQRPEQELQRGALWVLKYHGEKRPYTASERALLYPLVKKAVDKLDPLVRPSALPVLPMVTPQAPVQPVPVKPAPARPAPAQ